MAPFDTAHNAGRDFDERFERAGDYAWGKSLPFHHSLNFRGLLFILLVVLYILGITLFYVSQREQHIGQLEEYQRVQQAEEALNRADLAAFHVVTVLFSEVTDAELRQVISYFNTLRQHYQELERLFPQQAASFQQLLQSIPDSTEFVDANVLRAIHFHLAKSKNELERLQVINQERMQQVVRSHDRKRNEHILETLFLATIGLIALSGLTSIFFQRLKSDLRALQFRTEEILKGFRGNPLPITRNDELGLLTGGINSLSQSLAAREYDLEVARRRSSFREKMLAVDALAGGIAHEIGNPLTCIAGLTDGILNDSECHLSPHSRRDIEQIQASIAGLEKITRDISYLDIKKQDQPEWLDLNTLIDNTIKIFQYDSRYSAINIHYTRNPDLGAVFSTNDLLVLLLTNLFENAKDAIGDQDRAQIEVSTEQLQADCVHLRVEDNGPGVNAKQLEKIFEPFYSTKTLGQGSGLGLAVCWSICGALGGGIEASPSPLGGLRVEVTLPVNPAAGTSSDRQDTP